MHFISLVIEIIKSDWYALAALFLFSYAIRSLFLTIESGDLNYTLYQFKKTRINSFGTHWAKDSVAEGVIAYPTLLHWFYARIPTRFRIGAAYFFNTSYDCVNVLLLYLFLRCFGDAVFPGSENHGLLFSFLVALAYSTCPLFFPITERLKNFGGRTFGVLVFMTAHAAYFIGFFYSNMWFCLLAGLLSLVIILSSWFAMQALVFSFVFLSLFYMSYVPLAFLSVVFITGLLIPGLGIRTLLVYKINQSIWYWRNFQKHSQTNAHNSILGLMILPYNLVKNRREFWLTIFYHNGFLIALLSLAVVPLTIWLQIQYRDFGWEELLYLPVLEYCIYLIAAMAITFVLTGFKPLIIFGQNERYLEYAAPFIYLIFGFIISGLPAEKMAVFSVLLIVYQISLILLVYKVNHKYLNASSSNDSNNKREIAAFLNTYQKPLRIIFYPAKENYELSYFTNNAMHKFYYMFVAHDKVGGMPMMEADLVKYNAPITDVFHFKNKYQINTFIIDKLLYKDYKTTFVPQSSVCLYENERYIVLFRE